MTGLIQGSDAVLSFFKESYIPYVCATDISLSITSDKLPVRTVKDGNWKKFAYQALSYTVTLSGLLKFDDANWTGWDFADNQTGFVQVSFQLTFTDDQGNIKSMRGTAMIETNTTTISVGALVKQDFTLQGSGKLDIFDGLVPCASVITGITFSGLSSGAGDVTVNYTYTGDPYQIKYRLNDMGDWLYAVVSGSLSLPGMAIGDYDIEIIPVCLNGYEGTGDTASFTVTHALSCSSVITGITIDSSYVASYTYTGSPVSIRYRVDGGVWVNALIGVTIPLGGNSVGAHTVEIDPICSNGIVGTGATQSFTITSQPAQSKIPYTYNIYGSGYLSIYVNGVLNVNRTAGSSSGAINAPTGATVRVVLNSITVGTSMSLIITDSTTSTVISSQSAPAPDTLEYSFTANGDIFQINASITP